MLIKDLIAVQISQETFAFITHLKSRNKRHDTRNVDLYKALLVGKEKKIQQEIGSNAYNALKKRLTDQLIEFRGAKQMSRELTDENHVIKLIVLARELFNENRVDSGYVLLKRAEKKAAALDHFSLLNEVYHTMIEHSHKTQKFVQEELFANLERNNNRFLAQERLNVLFASIQQQFTSRSFNVLPVSFHQMYQEKCETFGINQEAILNFKSMNQLCVFADLYASQTKSYHKLDLFFEPLIDELQGGEKDTEKMLNYHIELLYGMANIYFRKKDASKSMVYLERMNANMQRFNQKHNQEWEAKYVNLLSLNLNFTGSFQEAASLLSTTVSTRKLNDIEQALLSLSYCMICSQQEDYKEVKRIIASFNKTDGWYLKHMGNEWLFNLKAIEVLLHIDLGNDLLAESRIHSFQRKYGVHFRNQTDNPIWPFLGLVKSILYHHDAIHTKVFAEKVEKSIPWKGEEEDLFNVCFYAWLKAKMLRTPIYETTLGILKYK